MKGWPLKGHVMPQFCICLMSNNVWLPAKFNKCLLRTKCLCENRDAAVEWISQKEYIAQWRWEAMGYFTLRSERQVAATFTTYCSGTPWHSCPSGWQPKLHLSRWRPRTQDLPSWRRTPSWSCADHLLDLSQLPTRQTWLRCKEQEWGTVIPEPAGLKMGSPGRWDWHLDQAKPRDKFCIASLFLGQREHLCFLSDPVHVRCACFDNCCVLHGAAGQGTAMKTNM